MLRRLITIALLLALAGFAASFLQAQPGHTRIEWLGWRVEARTSLMVALGVGVIWLAISFDRLLGYIVGLPGRISGNFSARRQKQGHHALALGLIAASAGDGREALRQSKRAQRLVGSDTLTDLLTAQAAALNGDNAAAARFFETLAAEKSTAFLGQAGLMRLEAETGDDDAALTAGRAAFALNKKAPALAKALFILEARQGHWAEAITALDVARRDPQMTAPEVAAAFAALYVEQARAGDDAAAALKNLELALKHDPGHGPAALAAARHYAEAGKLRKCTSVLETAFARTPHPEVAQALLKAWGDDENALAKLIRLTEKLGHPPAALTATARLAMRFDLWGEALRLITLIREEERNLTAWQILADLAEHPPAENSPAEHSSDGQRSGDDGTGQDRPGVDWPDRGEALMRAATAPQPPAWACRSCGTSAMDWASTCSSCGSFARISWR